MIKSYQSTVEWKKEDQRGDCVSARFETFEDALHWADDKIEALIKAGATAYIESIRSSVIYSPEPKGVRDGTAN